MYEDKTIDTIHKDVLNSISNSYEKTVGYIVFDLTRAYAIEEAKTYKELKTIYDKLDVNNLKGDELARFIEQRTGVKRKEGTAATTDLTVVGNGTINIGDLFETPLGIRYKAIETKTISNTGIVKIQAINTGTVGNVLANTITQMPVTLPGITSVTNLNEVTNGYDAEVDQSLRQRYYERLQAPATSGNKQHYKIWAKEVTGVGDAIITPLWNGPGTVKVIIINSNKRAADSSLINAVSDHIEENRPIGATVSVVSATEKAINISAKIVIDTKKYTLETIQITLENNLSQYFNSIAFTIPYASYAGIGNIIYNTDGIIDYSNLLVNEGSSNTALTDEEIPVLGTVSLEV